MNLIFDPILVELVEQKNDENSWEITRKIEERAEEILPEGYFGSAEDLIIQWLPVSTKFIINEYDGAEWIITTENLWLEA